MIGAERFVVIAITHSMYVMISQSQRGVRYWSQGSGNVI